MQAEYRFFPLVLVGDRTKILEYLNHQDRRHCFESYTLIRHSFPLLRPSQLRAGCEGGTEIKRPSKLNS
jgi:hypothetical protein